MGSSAISGAFEGEQTNLSLIAGGYVVHALTDTVFADGFVSVSAGRNTLQMADEVLSLEGEYVTQTLTAGGSLTGVYDYGHYELRPELAFSVGTTRIGTISFEGEAYGLTESGLSLDARTITTSTLTLRPEVIYALEDESLTASRSHLSFAPRLLCERTQSTTTTNRCGRGAEIGVNSSSEDGLSSASFRVMMDRVGASNRTSYEAKLQFRF